MSTSEIKVDKLTPTVGTALELNATTLTGTGFTYVNNLIETTVDKHNYIINGNFDFWQRGTSLAVTNALVYKCDRWWVYATNSAVTVARIASTDPNSTYAARIYATGSQGASQDIIIRQSLESVNLIPIVGKAVTVSFRYRNVVNATNVWGLNAFYDTGTANLINPTTLIDFTAIPNSASWATFTHTFTIPANALSFSISIETLSNAVINAEIQISKVMLNEGSIAAPFRLAGGDYAGELNKCLRYYYKSITNDYSMLCSTTTTWLNGGVKFPAPMRNNSVNVTLRDDAGLSNHVRRTDTGASIALTTPTYLYLTNMGFSLLINGGASFVQPYQYDFILELDNEL